MMLASQAIAKLEAFGERAPVTLSGVALQHWQLRREIALLDALTSFAALTDTQDELADTIEQAKLDAGWLRDEQGVWHEPGTEAHDIAQREQLAADYGDMRAKGG